VTECTLEARGGLFESLRAEERASERQVHDGESAAHLERAISFVMTGQPLDLGPNFLDVAWR
jgi:hypothetical protein